MSGHKPYGIYERFFKRLLDFFLSLIALVFLIIPMCILALFVKRKLGSPVLFSQDRPGKDEKIFRLYKFRTMTDKKDEQGNLLPDSDRLTSFGKKLRATSLDELPELMCIIKGDMSIVGPRPLSVKYLPFYTEEERHRHDVRPGLTGLAQIKGRNSLSWEAKFKYDLEYVNKITFLGDVKIIFGTVLKVIKKSDIGQGEEAPISLHILRKDLKQ